MAVSRHTSVHLKMGGLSKMSRLMTSSSGVALMRSVTMSVQWPKIRNRRAFCVPGSSWPPAGSLWKAYLQRMLRVHAQHRTHAIIIAICWPSIEIYVRRQREAHHCIFPSPTSEDTKYWRLPRKTR